ncbi:MAG TPA: hypothetical protein VM911_15115 [Pyrinomonadaceae bacterium]|nr:hypothetical protein [Pyrinomonadaceae bacterium]
MGRAINSIVFAPYFQAGGVKSLYSVCEWLSELGRSTIASFVEPKLVSWFEHHCELYDYSYSPDLLVYPEVFQPYIKGKYHLCFALGKRAPVEPHANLIVCKSHEILSWVKEQHPNIKTALISPSINRAVFEYQGEPKREIISYMTRPQKHPETAELLRREYGDKVFEIVNFSEAEVAEALKRSKVFVWRGDDKEGSPRPPKEALVAACLVVGLESDLNERYHTDFGVRCKSVEELIQMAGEALRMTMPTREQRSVVRDSLEEKQDWLALLEGLGIGRAKFAWLRR